MLLGLVFYLYGIVGMMLFRTNDPWHFGDLHTTMVTLFRCSTLEVSPHSPIAALPAENSLPQL